MIFLFLLPFYLGVSSYMMFRFFYWMKHCNHRFNWLRFKVPFAVVYLFMALSPVIAFLLPKSAVAIVIRRLSTYWIGIMLYSLLYVVLFDLLRLIAKHTKLKNTLLFSRGSVISIGSVEKEQRVFPKFLLFLSMLFYILYFMSYTYSYSKQWEDTDTVKHYLRVKTLQ